jgi:hypothetical protein
MQPKGKKAKNDAKRDDVRLRISPEDKVRFQAAARRKGLSLSSWLRMLALESLERDGAS